MESYGGLGVSTRHSGVLLRSAAGARLLSFFSSFFFCLFYLYYVTSSLSCAVCVAASAQDPPFLGFPSHFSLSHAEIAHCVLTPSGGFPLVVLVPVALGSALTTR